MTKTFPSWRKQLAALSGFAAVAVLFNALYGPYNGAVSGILWDYAIDPVVLAVAVVFVAASVRDSLRDRQQPGSHLAQIPQDVVTALIAVFWVRYLIQYNDKMAPGAEAIASLWGHLDAIAVVVLALQAIILWRSASPRTRGSHEDI